MFLLYFLIAGYSGLNCEFKDPCDSQPCQNGGICSSFSKDSTNVDELSYSCLCSSKFGGDKCEKGSKHAFFIDISTLRCLNLLLFLYIAKTCAENPCLNGASCEETSENDVKCICAKGFSGEDCSLISERDSGECGDSFKFCEALLKRGSCKLYGSKCRKTCGLC